MYFSHIPFAKYLQTAHGMSVRITLTESTKHCFVLLILCNENSCDSCKTCRIRKGSNLDMAAKYDLPMVCWKAKKRTSALPLCVMRNSASHSFHIFAVLLGKACYASLFHHSNNMTPNAFSLQP